MLEELRVQNFGLIDALTLRLEPGLNLLTGETGAGKSMIVDALAALLGGRVISEMVRGDRDSGVLEGRFNIAALPHVRERLRAMGIDPRGDELLLVREIAGGRSHAYIAGRAATVAMLRDIGEWLVEIHGQHEGQRLLQPATHLDLLDGFAGSEALGLRAEVAARHAERERLRAELRGLHEGERERVRRMDLLAYQAQEIDAARIQAGEEEELRRRHARLVHADRLLQLIHGAYGALYDEESSAHDAAGRALAALREAAALDETLRPLLAVVEAAQQQMAEAAHGVRRHADGLDADPERLAEVEARLDVLHRLARKYGDTTGEILRYRAEIGREMEMLAASDARVEEVARALAGVEEKLGRACAHLSEIRKRAAARLCKAVVGELAGLDMPRVAFEVAMAYHESEDGVEFPRNPGPNGRRLRVTSRGADDVEFMFSANPGEPPLPLARIASGGEAARIMLAIKSILAAVDQTPTLVFDEIDAGIGGAAAQAVGEKLCTVAAARQVLCITHLAPIASLADVHFHIAKQAQDGGVRLVLRRLDGEARVAEIARMLGGRRPTTIATQHASEMLQRAREASRKVRSKAGVRGG